MKVLERLFERVKCEREPGPVRFFHCKLLHCFGANLSESPRHSVIMCNNALPNLLLEIGYQESLTLGAAAEHRVSPDCPDDGITHAASSAVAG